MQELLLYMGSGGNYQFCPEGITGPGPQCMSYVEMDDKGFFGEVTGEELITMSDLTSQLGVTQGTAQNLDTHWLKFYLDGRILFVAKKTIRHSISYDYLMTLDLTNNVKTITINGLQYSVGLLSGIDDDYDGDVTNGINQPWTMRSEWTRLMYNTSIDVSTAAYHKQGQIGDNWAEYPQDNSTNGLNINTGNGRNSWTRSLNPTNLAQNTTRGNYVTRVSLFETFYPTTNLGWRPVLELDLELHAPDLQLYYRYSPNDFFTDDELFDAPPVDLKHSVFLPNDPIEELLP